MRKNIGKGIVLVLTLALIISLSISAFAATTYSRSEPFNEGEHTIYADGTIRAADTYGSISSHLTGNYLKIDLTCSYDLDSSADTMNLEFEYLGAESDRYCAEVEFNAPAGTDMYQARYTFRADVYTSAGQNVFGPYSPTLTWE